jgi:predicted GIY-YIG superfamily endonuclease
MKICRKCTQKKSLTEFPQHSKTADGLGHMCTDCRRALYKPGSRKRITRQEGYLYLVQATNGPCKIGITNDVETRLRVLRNQSPVALAVLLVEKLPNAIGTEAELHTLFKNQYSHGEWFNLTDENIKQAKEIICHAKQALIASLK